MPDKRQIYHILPCLGSDPTDLGFPLLLLKNTKSLELNTNTKLITKLRTCRKQNKLTQSIKNHRSIFVIKS